MPDQIDGISSDWVDTECGSATNASRSIGPDLTPDSRVERRLQRTDQDERVKGFWTTSEVVLQYMKPAKRGIWVANPGQDPFWRECKLVEGVVLALNV